MALFKMVDFYLYIVLHRSSAPDQSPGYNISDSILYLSKISRGSVADWTHHTVHRYPSVHSL